MPFQFRVVVEKRRYENEVEVSGVGEEALERRFRVVETGGDDAQLGKRGVEFGIVPALRVFEHGDAPAEREQRREEHDRQRRRFHCTVSFSIRTPG